ncbi:YlqD family protein [Bacillus luteolus]|uniref:YlqD family protein n=1 Tax=Litchfieldia luteola TaxID=682179 RepID=A0ABR9QJT6_9BACI|nr:YlqD family protein [Cytobacillus luteolus]MBE4908752.1 YlqD family protein [Cytobacillus luteolus]MBP1941611.1 superfamily II DNA helicase RecQ [Cytobacillus luteolus]
MQLLQTVVVKQILTEHSKTELMQNYESRKDNLLKECDQLRFEGRKLAKNKKYNPTKVQSHYEKEIVKREEKIKILEFQLEQLHILPIGSELKEREVQAIVDIKIGDKWEDLNSNTIIIKDGIVDEIRQG